MKNIIFTLGVALLILSGCKNDLDVSNPNELTTETFWKTKSDAEMGINSVYSALHRVGLARNYFFITILRSDIGQSKSPNPAIVNCCDVFDITDYNQFEVKTSWDDCYAGINRANQVLDNVPDIEMDEDDKNAILGEAKFFRGYFYYQLAVLWGNVPVYLHTADPNVLPETKPQDSVFARVEKDLQDATTLLPETWDAGDLGRVTKGAAYAYLGKAYMQQHQYDKAEEALKWIVEGPGKSLYSLVPNYRDNFLEATENNKESIFEIQNAVNEHDNHDDDNLAGPDNLNLGYSLPPFFAPRPVGFTDGQSFRWVVHEFLKEKTIDKKRDPRLAATFLYDSTDERGPDYSLIYGKTWSSLGYSDDPNIEPNNFDVCFRKFLNDADPNVQNEAFHSGNNYRQIRLGGILLLYAEALNELDRTSEAYPYVDLVRERAGLPSLSVAKPNLDKDQFLEQLKHERIVELAGEAHRWEDLARWGDLSNSLSSRDPAFKRFKPGRDEFLPIPQQDLDINPNMKQNPGF